MLEPRGHTDMCGVALTEPHAPGSHAGLLFMDNDGFGELSVQGILAATTIALERGLVMPGGDGGTVAFDTTAGTIRARAVFAAAVDGPATPGGGEADAARAARKVQRASVLLPPSFVFQGGLPVKLGTRLLRADVAFGGAFHAIVDAEAAGVPIDAAHASDLRRAGMDIKRAVEASLPVVHPAEPRIRGVYGTVFTGPPHAGDADLRAVTVFADAALDRSPSGTGVAAIMAVLDAIGLMAVDRPGKSFVCEGLLGTRLTGRVAGRSKVGEYDAILPELEGSSWIVGEQTLFVDETDPFALGFRV
jgi:proline racemase